MINPLRFLKIGTNSAIKNPHTPAGPDEPTSEVEQKLKVGANGAIRNPHKLAGPELKSVEILLNAIFRDEYDKPLSNINFSNIDLSNTDLSSIDLSKIDDNDYLEYLIQKNIIGRYKSNPELGEKRAREARAFIDTLSSINKIRFAQILKANPDIEMVEFGGGVFKSIMQTPASIVINTMLEMLGKTYTPDCQDLKPITYIGTSAGSFHAGALASRALNRSLLNVTCHTDFDKFPDHHDKPEHKSLPADDTLKGSGRIQAWVNRNLRRSLFRATGRMIKDATHKDLLSVGSNLQVIVGGIRYSPPKLPQAYFAPRDLETKFGVDPESIPVKKLIWSTMNNPKFYKDFLRNCPVEDKKERRLYLFDIGFIDLFNVVVRHLLKKEIEIYKKDKTKTPGLCLVINTKRGPEENYPLYSLGQITTKLKAIKYNLVRKLDGFLERYKFNNARRLLEDIGAHKGLIEIECHAVHPETGVDIKIHSFDFDLPAVDRSTAIASKIPTKEFPETSKSETETVIGQLYRNFVRSGKTARDLWLEDIEKAPKNKLVLASPSRSTFMARLSRKNGNGKKSPSL